MTDHELPLFLDTLRKVVAVFPIRGGDEDFQRLAGSYFKALRRFSLADVQAGADAWTHSQTRFPKPVEWIQAIPRRQQDYRTMPPDEAREHRRAELLHYQDVPCGCQSCVSAGVADRPRRFVPEVDEDTGADFKAWNPLTTPPKLVTPGRWIHGEELRRWYVARDEFFALATRLKSPIAGAVLAAVGREPGEEG